MRLTNDVMNILGIKTIVISTKLGDAPCAVTDATGNIWVCFTTVLPENKDMLFRVKTVDGFVRFKGKVETTLDSNKPGLHTFVVRVFPDSPIAKKLLDCFFNIEKRKSEWNKRSEDRWPVGNERVRVQALGLSSPAQSVYVNKRAYQCCIKDVSFHGLGIIVFSAPIKIGDNVYIRLSFENPTECIHITGNVVSLIEKKQNNIIVSTVGLATTSSSMSYMGRIALYAAKMERVI